MIALSVDPPLGGRQTIFTFSAGSLTGESLDFEWDLDQDGIFEVPTGGFGSLSTAFPLGEQDILGAGGSDGVGVAVRTVTVRAFARNGHYATRSLLIALENSAPVVDAGGDVYFTPGSASPVLLDACGGFVSGCTSTDPEGDPLTFLWDDPTGVSPPISVLDSSGRHASLVPGAREATYRIRANDGLASAEGTITAWPAHQVWIGTHDPGRLYRAFPEFYARSSARSGAGTVAFATLQTIAAASDEVWIAESGPTATVRRLSSDAELLETFPTSDIVVQQIAALGDGSACAVVRSATPGGSGAFYRFTTAAAPVAVADAAPAAVLPIDDGSGDCWIVGAALGRMHPDGSVSVVIAQTVASASPSSRPSAAVATPDGALWVFLDTAGVDRGLHRLAPGGSSLDSISGATGDVPLLPDPDDATGKTIIAVRSGLLDRVTVSGRVPAPDLPPSLAATQASLVSFDATARAAWIADATAGVVRRLVDRGGVWRSSDLAFDEISMGERPAFYGGISVDRVTGTAYGAFLGPQNLVVRLPGHLKRLEAVPIAVSGGALDLSPDPSLSRVWTVREGSSEAFKTGEAGSPLVTYALASPIGAFAGLSDGGLLLSPAGATTLFRVDGVHETPGAFFDVPAGIESIAVNGTSACIATGSTNAALLSLSSAQVIPIAGLPAPASRATSTRNGGCWFLGASDASFVPAGAGAVSASASGFSTMNALRASADPSDESVWIADTANARVVHVSTTGGTLAAVPITAPLDVGVFTCAGSPGCIDGWTLAADGTISRFDSAGVRDVFTLPLGSPARLLTVP